MKALESPPSDWMASLSQDPVICTYPNHKKKNLKFYHSSHKKLATQSSSRNHDATILIGDFDFWSMIAFITMFRIVMMIWKMTLNSSTTVMCIWAQFNCVQNIQNMDCLDLFGTVQLNFKLWGFFQYTCPFRLTCS